MGLTRLKVDGFRRLCGIDIELRPLTVLIGPNGSGKTSLLEVISLFSAAAQANLQKTINDKGGFSALVTGDGRSRFSMGFSLPESGLKFEYDATLAGQGLGYVIEYELLTSDGQVLHQSPTGFETSCLATPTLSTIASTGSFDPFSTRPRSPVRTPQQGRPATLPGRDAEDLVSCLYSLRESDRATFETILDSLRAAFPTFDRLDSPLPAAGVLSLAWRDKRFSQPLYAHQLSDGTLRFLWLATLLASPALPAITMIDEPEVSLHPELLSLLADLLRGASLRSQIFVATHSDRLVRFLKPEEVLVTDLDQESGLVRFTWADQMDLEKWLEEYTIDEIWRMGRIGGRA